MLSSRLVRPKAKRVIFLSHCTRVYLTLLCPAVGMGAISVAFVRPSVRPSVCLCPSVAYIANNSRTQRPSVPTFGRKVPHLRCDSHTSFKVKRSKERVRGGRGHTVSAEPGGDTDCYMLFVHSFTYQLSVV